MLSKLVFKLIVLDIVRFVNYYVTFALFCNPISLQIRKVLSGQVVFSIRLIYRLFLTGIV